MTNPILRTPTMVRLARHGAIGWDFDQTLVRNPENARHFWEFIKTTPEKRHVIVTFRSGGLEAEVWRDLAKETRLIGAENFTDVLNIGDQEWLDHNDALALRRAGVLTGVLTPAEVYYLGWKGQTCRQNGLTAMVDDDIPMVMNGCERHGVTFFDSLYPLEDELEEEDNL